MQAGQPNWVRFCAAMHFMELDKDFAIDTLRDLSNGEGMFVPVCIALLADQSVVKS